MLKFFWKIYRSVPDEMEERLWRCDPLTHPALAAMTQRELADLPLPHDPPPALDGESACN